MRVGDQLRLLDSHGDLAEVTTLPPRTLSVSASFRGADLTGLVVVAIVDLLDSAVCTPDEEATCLLPPRSLVSTVDSLPTLPALPGVRVIRAPDIYDVVKLSSTRNPPRTNTTLVCGSCQT